MGGTNWSDEEYHARQQVRATTGQPTFGYHAKMASTPRASQKVHDSLDPKRLNKAGGKVRESRDSTEHPNSKAIAVFLDVTGSMLEVPKTVQRELHKLMGLIIRDGCLKDPQILIGAVGDANCDQAPLQVGQFESGIEIENDLTNLFLEEGGGGQAMETYELAMYFLARYADLDCLNKRGEKGYCFIIGDEAYYPAIHKDQVEKVIGDTIEANISTEQVVRDLQEKFEVFYIQPNLTTYYQKKSILDPWRKLLGENVLTLDKPEGICGLIASTIAVRECGDWDAAEEALKAAGTDLAVVASIGRSLKGVAAGSAKQGCDLAVTGSGAASGVEAL
jgi:hypothetical protein